MLNIITHPLTEYVKGKRIDVKHLLQGLPAYIKASQLAREDPDIFTTGSALFR